MALHIFNAIAAAFGNAVVLAAHYKESFPYPLSKNLLRSLALIDFFVGIFLNPLFVTFLVTKVYEFCYLFFFFAN